MKRITVILAFALCTLATVRAQPAADSSALETGAHRTEEAPAGRASQHEIWDSANSAYMGGDYGTAVEMYNSLLQSGKHSAKLYYNLGNAYFKLNQLGQAILNYNRAQLLDPGDDDIAYNLAMANTRTVDKIEEVPEFFLVKWIRSVGFRFNSNTWAVAGLAMLTLSLAAVILWLVSRTMPLRKTGFYGAILGMALCIVSLSYAQSARNRQTGSHYGIVMNTAAPVKSSPSASSQDIFILHEGTKFTVHETLDGWYEISIADGNKGWISENAVELIN